MAAGDTNGDGRAEILLADPGTVLSELFTLDSTGSATQEQLPFGPLHGFGIYVDL